MLSIQARMWFSASIPLAALAVVALTVMGGPARAEPPIRSPEDALCRLEARAKVFTAPNPQGLELEAIGRQIYYACMKRLSPPAVQPVRHGRKRHVHRHRRR